VTRRPRTTFEAPARHERGPSPEPRQRRAPHRGLELPDSLLPPADALALGEPIQGSLQEAGSLPTVIVFFSIASIQSQRLMAYAQAWHERYQDSGLQVVGVHSPELDRTRSESALRVTLQRWGVTFPVVQDPERKIWFALGNVGWDSCHVFARSGRRRFEHPAGAPMRQIELDLQQVLRLKQPPRLFDPLFPEDAPGTVRLQSSPDVPLGFRMGEIANLEGFLPQQTIEYQPVEATGAKPVLQGGWEASAESLISRPQQGRRSILDLRCVAREVFVLAEAPSELTLHVESSDTASSVSVHELMLYELVQSETLRDNRLRLWTDQDGLQLYLLRFTTEARKDQEAE
jgi:thioredoxin family protein